MVEITFLADSYLFIANTLFMVNFFYYLPHPHASYRTCKMNCYYSDLF